MTVRLKLLLSALLGALAVFGAAHAQEFGLVNQVPPPGVATVSAGPSGISVGGTATAPTVTMTGAYDGGTFTVTNGGLDVNSGTVRFGTPGGGAFMQVDGGVQVSSLGVNTPVAAYPLAVHTNGSGGLSTLINAWDSDTYQNLFGVTVQTGQVNILASWRAVGHNEDLSFSPTKTDGTQNPVLLARAATQDVLIQGSGGLSLSSPITPQIQGTGAATFLIQGATGQTTALDCGGGTCTAALGVTNATTTTVGRTAQTTNLNGNLAHGVKYVTGTFTGTQVTVVVASQNFGTFTPSVVGTSQKLGNVQCMLVGTLAGVGAAGTLVIYDVTAAANLCTPYSASFNCASAAGVGTPAAASVVSCNAALTAGHQYSYQLSGCTSYPTGFECTTEILAP